MSRIVSFIFEENEHWFSIGVLIEPLIYPLHSANRASRNITQSEGWIYSADYDDLIVG